MRTQEYVSCPRAGVTLQACNFDDELMGMATCDIVHVDPSIAADVVLSKEAPQYDACTPARHTPELFLLARSWPQSFGFGSLQPRFRPESFRAGKLCEKRGEALHKSR